MVEFHALSKSNGEKLVKEMRQVWPSSLDLGDPKKISVARIDEQTELLFSEKFTAVRLQHRIIPFLNDEKLLREFPSVVVDSGAIRFLCNGADVMRPGITSSKDSFRKNDIVVVQEEKYRKYIVVGIAFINSTELSGASKGVVVKNLHFVGDKTWEVYKQLVSQSNVKSPSI